MIYCNLAKRLSIYNIITGGGRGDGPLISIQLSQKLDMISKLSSLQFPPPSKTICHKHPPNVNVPNEDDCIQRVLCLPDHLDLEMPVHQGGVQQVQGLLVPAHQVHRDQVLHPQSYALWKESME